MKAGYLIETLREAIERGSISLNSEVFVDGLETYDLLVYNRGVFLRSIDEVEGEF